MSRVSLTVNLPAGEIDVETLHNMEVDSEIGLTNTVNVELRAQGVLMGMGVLERRENGTLVFKLKEKIR